MKHDINKSKVLAFRVESPFKDAILKTVERGGYRGQSDLMRSLLNESFEKFLTTEEMVRLVKSKR